MRKEIYRNGQLVEAKWIGSLDEHKQERIAEIDARTAELIGLGLAVAPGVRLSLSLAAQTNLQGMAITRLMAMPYVPQGVSTTDGREYVIEDEQEFGRVAALMQQRIKTLTDGGRDLRKQVLAAATHEAVDAIRDSRS